MEPYSPVNPENCWTVFLYLNFISPYHFRRKQTDTLHVGEKSIVSFHFTPKKYRYTIDQLNIVFLSYSWTLGKYIVSFKEVFFLLILKNINRNL